MTAQWKDLVTCKKTLNKATQVFIPVLQGALHALLELLWAYVAIRYKCSSPPHLLNSAWITPSTYTSASLLLAIEFYVLNVKHFLNKFRVLNNVYAARGMVKISFSLQLLREVKFLLNILYIANNFNILMKEREFKLQEEKWKMLDRIAEGSRIP